MHQTFLLKSNYVSLAMLDSISSKLLLLQRGIFMITLSISDQSHIFGGQTAQEALHNSITLAQMADAHGYKRFWVTEHHNNPTMACASPEILTAAIAANTNRIRVGSGCVMLPYYSSFKVAETFRMLHTLFPNRIDLGVGRGSGVDIQVSQALKLLSSPGIDEYVQQIRDLIGFLTNTLPVDHAYKEVLAMPDGSGTPEIWILGTSTTSIEIAASQGLALCFAQLVGKSGISQTMETYRQRFRPSQFLDQPYASLAVQVFCMENEDEACRLIWNLSFLMMSHQKQQEKPICFPSKGEVNEYVYTEHDIAFIHTHPLPFIVGNPMQVKEKLLELAESSGVNELAINIFYPDFEVRLRSYQLLAEVFSLPTTTIQRIRA